MAEFTQASALKAETQENFVALVEPHRRELLAHCYRMMGSLQDAEDMLQEAFLRAWKGRATFHGTGTLRAWLYRIATNVCLDALEKRPKRALRHADFPPSDPLAPFAAPVDEPIWLEPFPDEWLPSEASSPEARYSAQESITLAFLTALQVLPPRQRAVLLLRDVLAWRASETASLLGQTVSSVNSALYRARSRLDREMPLSGLQEAEEAKGETTRLLERYVEAWQKADVEGLVALLREDALFTMPPSSSWYAGRKAIEQLVRQALFSAPPGTWWLLRTGANGQPAFGLYQQEGSSPGYQAFALMALRLRAGRIAEITVFMNPGLFPKFDLAQYLEA